MNLKPTNINIKQSNNNNKLIKASSIDNIKIKFISINNIVILKNILYIPKLEVNIISLN